MSTYQGDFAEDSTVYIPFNTFSSNDPQASVTATTLIASDLYVHKDGSVTNIVTDGATIAIDFDGIAGNHLITIDTSVHADYAVGSDYLVRIEGATVDAGLINAIVGSFSIENRYNAAADDLANATDGLGALKALLDAIPTVAEFNARTLLAAAYFDPAVDTVANVTLVDTATTVTNQLSAAAINAEVDTALVDIHLDHLLAVDYDPAVKPGVATALLNELVEDDLGVSRYTANALENAPSGTGASAATIADAVWDEAQADHVAVGSFGITASEIAAIPTTAMRGTDSALLAASINLTAGAVDTVTTVGTTTTNTDMRGTDSAATAAALATAQTDLNTITGADGVTLATSQGAITWGGVTISVIDGVNNITLAGSGNASGLAYTRSGVGSLFGTNWAAALESEVNDALVAYAPATETKQDIIDTNVDAILLDTNELQTNQGNFATATGFATETKQDAQDLIITEARLTELDAANLPADIAAIPTASEILTTQMTEAYAADGTAPTLAQAILLIQQTVGDFSISGTTLTAKELDGTTTAATYTLDSATAPTSRTRAT